MKIKQEQQDNVGTIVELGVVQRLLELLEEDVKYIGCIPHTREALTNLIDIFDKEVSVVADRIMG